MTEYILIRGVNDTPEEAHALGVLLEGRNVQVNLIPYNRTAVGDELGYASPSHDEVLAFGQLVNVVAVTDAQAHSSPLT